MESKPEMRFLRIFCVQSESALHSICLFTSSVSIVLSNYSVTKHLSIFIFPSKNLKRSLFSFLLFKIYLVSFKEGFIWAKLQNLKTAVPTTNVTSLHVHEAIFLVSSHCKVRCTDELRNNTFFRKIFSENGPELRN